MKIKTNKLLSTQINECLKMFLLWFFECREFFLHFLNCFNCVLLKIFENLDILTTWPQLLEFQTLVTEFVNFLLKNYIIAKSFTHQAFTLKSHFENSKNRVNEFQRPSLKYLYQLMPTIISLKKRIWNQIYEKKSQKVMCAKNKQNQLWIPKSNYKTSRIIFFCHRSVSSICNETHASLKSN